MIRCRVQMPDPMCEQAPFTFVTLGEFTAYRPKDDYLGEKFWHILNDECLKMGYQFKFYTMSSSSKHTYDVVVKEDRSIQQKISKAFEREVLDAD